jgi:hypothetical protein
VTVLVGEIAAAPLRVGAHGLSPKNQLLLRSCIRIIRAQTGRQWEYVDTPPYDVIVLSVDSATPPPASDDRPAPIVISFFDPDQAVVRSDDEGADEAVSFATDDDQPALTPAPSPFSLQAPIRPEEVTRLLDKVVRQMPKAVVAAVVAPMSVPAAAAAASFAARESSAAAAPVMAHSAADMTLDLHGVVRVLRQARQTSFVAVADAPFLLINPSDRTWRAIKPADDVLEPKVADIIAILARGTVRYQDATLDDLALPLGRTLPLEVLMWHLGLVLHPRSLLPIVLSRGRLKLARWPDFGRIGADHHYLKMSAMLASRPYDVEEVFQAIGEPRERVVAFLNACALCGLFADVPVSSTPASVPRVAPSQGGRPLGSLMQRLRGALGIGRA